MEALLRTVPVPTGDRENGPSPALCLAFEPSRDSTVTYAIECSGGGEPKDVPGAYLASVLAADGALSGDGEGLDRVCRPT